jgi:hypothetical protein
MFARPLAERLLVIAFALTFYCLGTTSFEAFVNYRTWPLIGAAEFRAYHRALTPLVVRVMLIPIAVYFLSLLALLVLRPTNAPWWLLATSFALLLLAIISSGCIQVPIQAALDRDGLSLPLIERLIVSDLALRKLPLALNALLWLGLFWRRA